jgi:2-phosphosulfolactate phosphatase
MLKINLIPTHSLVTDDLVLKDKNIVIVDVLRATSTMLVALANGAKEIIPAESVTTAAKIAKGIGKSGLLCGERGGKIIEGFALGNSPFEYTKEAVKNKSLIFSTTNGTVSMHKARYAKNFVLASFLNISVVAEYLNILNEDFTIICSGKLNNFCLEDFVFSGALISKLFKLGKNKNRYEISDTEIAAKTLSKSLVYVSSELNKQKITDMLNISEHGSYLKSLGFESDLEFCSGIDTYPYLPVLNKGLIKLQENIKAEEINKKTFKRVNLKDETGNKKP